MIYLYKDISKNMANFKKIIGHSKDKSCFNEDFKNKFQEDLLHYIQF